MKEDWEGRGRKRLSSIEVGKRRVASCRMIGAGLSGLPTRIKVRMSASLREGYKMNKLTRERSFGSRKV
jgi:hypothetical protein